MKASVRRRTRNRLVWVRCPRCRRLHLRCNRFPKRSNDPADVVLICGSCTWTGPVADLPDPTMVTR